MNRTASWGWKALLASVTAHGAVLTTALAGSGPQAVSDETLALSPVELVAASESSEPPDPRPDPQSVTSTPHSLPPRTRHTTERRAQPIAEATVAGAKADEEVQSEMPEEHAPAPTFVIALAPSAPRGASGAPLAGAAGEAASVETEASVSTPARLVRGGSPAYPPGAREQGVDADVTLEVVVAADGTVESARSVRRAGYGFDEAAVDAIRRYVFAPATRDGRAVRVRMRWTIEFRLR
jgi:protein TonB